MYASFGGICARGATRAHGHGCTFVMYGASRRDASPPEKNKNTLPICTSVPFFEQVLLSRYVRETVIRPVNWQLKAGSLIVYVGAVYFVTKEPSRQLHGHGGILTGRALRYQRQITIECVPTSENRARMVSEHVMYGEAWLDCIECCIELWRASRVTANFEIQASIRTYGCPQQRLNSQPAAWLPPVIEFRGAHKSTNTSSKPIISISC